MKSVKLILVTFAIAIFLIACTQTTDPKKPAANVNRKAEASPEVKATVDELASGRNNYKESCARCHKDDGTGGEVVVEGKKLNADDLTSEKMKKMSDEKYVKYITNGIPSEGMPAFKGVLSNEEIKEVIEFIRKEIQK